jgi:subfamily B ATP-binding cassette protein HlyB/CyaB
LEDALEAKELISILHEATIFSSLSEAELEHIAEATTLKNFAFGSTIAAINEPAYNLYLVKTGKVRLLVQKDGKEQSLGLVNDGETFGEVSLLGEQPYGFQARSSGKTEILVIPKSALMPFLSKGSRHRQFIMQYVALKLTGGFVSQLFNLKSKSGKKKIEETVLSIGMKTLPAGRQILSQDSSDDRRLYVVKEGHIGLSREEDGRTYDVLTLGPGDILGEKSCLSYAAQPYTATALSLVTLLVIPQQTFHFILEQNTAIQQILEDHISRLDKELNRQRKVSQLRRSFTQFSPSEKSPLGATVLKGFELVEQAEEMDCGAACLAMICKHHNISITLGTLREMINVTTEGATMDSLARAGESLGFSSKGVRCTYSSLLTFECPFIAHWQGYHFIVIYGVSKNHVWIADPGEGFKKLSVEEFEKGWTGNCLLLTKTAELFEGGEVKSSWKRFFDFVKPVKSLIRDLLIASLVIQILGLATPVIIQNILDRVVVQQNVSLLNMMIIGLAVAKIFSLFTQYLSSYFYAFLTRKMDYAMLSQFYQHVMSLPVDFFVKRKTGDIVARFRENIVIREFMTESSIGTGINTVMVLIYLVVLFQYNAQLTWLLLGLLAPLMTTMILTSKKYKEYSRKAFHAQADADSLLLETLNGAESVKAMSVERSMRQRWEKKYLKALEVKFKSALFNISVSSFCQLFQVLVTVMVLYVGAKLTLNHDLTIGQMMAYFAIVGSIMTPLFGLVGIWDEFHETVVAMERLGDVLDLAPEQDKKTLSSRVVLPEIEGDIVCKDLYFKYSDNDPKYILSNINLTIPDGATVAIVGNSGSGKTTLAKLLVGLYKPTEGTVLVDGHDLQSVNLEYYRKNIGYVMQNNLLFSGTVSENIAMGEIEFDQQRIVEAAKLADAHGFISALPQGYLQKIGERGAGLSGGQIQRICIARALYSNPKLLVLDEATSSLDGVSESQILNNLKKILENRTAVIIAHRLSTIQQADKILVLYDGHITEEGTHEELLQKKSMYYQLVNKQMTA